jgi:hypothetical protein
VFVLPVRLERTRTWVNFLIAMQNSTEVRYLRFFLDGMRIKRDHTIAMLNMEDDSEIQALIEAEGGV